MVQRELGEKTGANLWDMAHGRDSRAVEPPKPRRSLGAEVNWGIRFRNQQEADAFLAELAGEVQHTFCSEVQLTSLFEHLTEATACIAGMHGPAVRTRRD